MQHIYGPCCDATAVVNTGVWPCCDATLVQQRMALCKGKKNGYPMDRWLEELAKRIWDASFNTILCWVRSVAQMLVVRLGC